VQSIIASVAQAVSLPQYSVKVSMGELAKVMGVLVEII
jgi:hypothetical protein